MAASSLRMSPNMFSATITSKWRGWATSCMAALSTSMCSSRTFGYSLEWTLVTTSRHRREVSSTLALSTLVTRASAASKATRAMRSTSPTLYTHVSNALSASRPRSPKYRPPVSSRTTSRLVPSMTSRRSGLAS